MADSPKFIPILLGSDINAYGMARSFHQEYKIKSEAIGSKQLAATRFSHIVKVKIVPDFNEEEVFIETLTNLAINRYNDPNITYLLIPCGDSYAELVSKYQKTLSQWFSFPAIDHDLLLKLSDKVSFYNICEEYGLPYPTTYIVDKEMYDQKTYLNPLPFDFPIAIKPTDSVEYLNIHFEGKKKAYIIEGKAEYDLVVDRIYQSGYTKELIIQEFVAGDDSNMRVLNAYVDSNHQVRMMFLGQPLLEDPFPASIGNYVAILPDDHDEIYQNLKRFLEDIQYTGFANIDMKYDPKDGRFKLFEINLRQGRSSFFVTLNGINLAKLIIDEFVYQTPFTGTVYGRRNDDQKFWLGVPTRVFKKYAADNPQKEKALELMKKGKVGTTVFYPKDYSLTHFSLMVYMFYRYNDRFDTFFKSK
ncbi:carboxylate--amine ligase [Jeotgalibaca sp. MA1X17-3]|uniref:carboxylate--amine ligase n=1 Tax=Jeotgalibaca sp. MA1X17-3 TaxID=2908211 RepID=UPI001F3DECD8|nr:carboxylate--amine ligase [Jeotgalibaca sp. MA1X17-3]UJF15278.1 carboxylate--amine ligase [Jeotgalibaca sp. MA1X17-3]